MEPGAGGVALRLRGLVKRYGHVAAVDSVDLDVAPGEFLTLLGPSGSGKTSLLHMIAGFLEPTAGDIFLGDTRVTDHSPHRRGIGMVFQHYALFPHMTVLQNVAFPLRVRHVPWPEARKRVVDALEMVSLSGLEHRRPRQLSGGQQQRVALARALVFHPRLLLMDEPLGALDKKLREQMQLEIRRLQRTLGTTTIYVTHDQTEGLVMSDRIAVMEGGRISQVATAAEIYDHPATRFVATFVGESNVFAGRISSLNGTTCAVAVTPNARVSVRAPAGASVGDELHLALRPERISAVDVGGGAGPNFVTGTVEERVFLGDSQSYRVRVDGVWRLAIRTPRRAGSRVFEIGETIRLAWQAEDLVVLDRNPGGAL